MSKPRPASLEFCHHYLPVTDELLHGGAYVTSVGRSQTLPGESYPPQRHPSLYHFDWTTGRTLPEFGLIFIAEGGGDFESQETGKVPLTRGTVVMLFPGVWHRYRPQAATGWTEKWVKFNGAFVHTLFEQNPIIPAQAVLRPDDPLAVSRNLDRLIEAVHRNPSANSPRLALLALGAIALALDQSIPAPTALQPRPTPASTRDSLVEDALDYIWTRSHKVLSSADVATAIGTTRRTLERHMKSAGRSILEEIIQCRFSRAERLLRETDLPLKAVVNLSGFGSLENLRQAFIARTGLPPAAYRARPRPGSP